MRLVFLFLLAFSTYVFAQPALDPVRVRAAADYAKAQAGLSLVIWQNGNLVLSESHNNGNVNAYYELASGTKSFNGIIAAAAVADGFLTFDELASDTITEWKADPRKSRITIRMLLHLVSGLQANGVVLAPTYAEAVAAVAADEPGTHFVYDPVHFQAFGEVMRRKLAARGGGSPVDYLKARVLDRIGLVVGNWRNGDDGNPLMPQGAQLAASEWIKFGEFIRLEGNWNGTQVLPVDLIREVMKPGPVNPAYGMTWWLNHPMDPALLAVSTVPEGIADGHYYPQGNVNIHMAAGAGNQRLYVIPEYGVVVARQSPVVNGSSYSDETFLSLLLPPAPVSLLKNLSTRSTAGTGEASLIGGFSIGGTRSKVVLIRAAGPTLTAFGLTSAIVDPQLQVFDEKGVLVKANDNWGSAYEASQLPAAFATAGAFLFPAASKDAAVLANLVPGNYTVVVTPASGSPGTALVEVYEMPADFTF